MADKQSGLKPTRTEKQVNALDTVAKKLLGTMDNSFKERTLLTKQDAKVQQILSDELNFSRGVAGGSIVDFASSMVNKSTKNRNGEAPEVDIMALFTKDVGDIYGYFQDMYKNRYIEISDLKFISKFIPAIGEAVKTTLDNIVSADDISDAVSRKYVFTSNMTETEQQQVTAELQRIEKEEKLLKKLKNIVYRKALVSGMSYVYHIPYSELFAEYDKRIKSGVLNPDSILANTNQDTSILKSRQTKSGFNLNNPKKATESTEALQPDGICWTIVNESQIESAIDGMSYLSKEEKLYVKKSFEGANFATITMVDDIYIEEALEGIMELNKMADSYVPPAYSSLYGGVGELSDSLPDGTHSAGGSTRIGKYKIAGTYLQFIDAKNVIPIRVYNQVLGYYYIHSQSAARRAKQKTTANTTRETNITSIGASIFSSANMTEKKKEQVITDIIDTIADGILSNFNTKFVTKNAEHKKLIADCLIANGIINNEYQIQFVPVEYMTAFTINEDEHGNGESILLDALFPAKLLLSLLISKLLTYMNKSGNKTIAYVGRGPADVNNTNQAQRVIRMMQEANITFNDLLSTNLVFSKFTRDSNIQIPRARNGDRLIELETQEGQQVDLRPEMEDWLEKMAIMGTGVPSVIMEYTDAADYAKSLTTANIKFAGRVASLQSDLEDATTDLYKMLIQGSSLSDELKVKAINGFSFKLPRPKVLVNANNADFLQTIFQTAQTVADIRLGQNNEALGEENKDAPKIRTEFIKKIVIDNTPFFDWDSIEKLYEQSVIDVKKTTNYDEEGSSSDASTNDMNANAGGEDLGGEF